MKDPKTTITAIIGTLIYLLTYVATALGIVVEVPDEVRAAIIVVTVFVLGLVARDGTRPA